MHDRNFLHKLFGAVHLTGSISRVRTRKYGPATSQSERTILWTYPCAQHVPSVVAQNGCHVPYHQFKPRDDQVLFCERAFATTRPVLCRRLDGLRRTPPLQLPDRLPIQTRVAPLSRSALHNELNSDRHMSR